MRKQPSSTLEKLIMTKYTFSSRLQLRLLQCVILVKSWFVQLGSDSSATVLAVNVIHVASLVMVEFAVVLVNRAANKSLIQS